jgi:hypothetical protein
MPQLNREELIRYALSEVEEPIIVVVEDAPLRTPEPEEIPPEMPQDEPSPVPETVVGSIPKIFPAGTCPNDGQPFQELGGARRCQICGCQPRVDGPPGVSRSEWDARSWRSRQ